MPTKIQWTINSDGSQGETWNPVSGCRRKSPGCLNCYAERQAHRLSGNPNEKIASLYGGVTQITNGRPGWSGKAGFSESALMKPFLTRKPTTYFISLSDLFYEERPEADIDRVFAVIALCQQHRFQVLTKYTERMHSYLSDYSARERIGSEMWFLIEELVDPNSRRSDDIRATAPDVENEDAWPLPNLWLGVSCEDQKNADERIPLLLQTPAAVRFLSLEPLLGPIDLEYPKSLFPDGPAMCCNGIDCGCMGIPTEPPLVCEVDWVIAGSESGPGARPAQEQWFRDIKNACKRWHTPFFLKQYADANGHKIGTPELDGQQWMQMPKVTA